MSNGRRFAQQLNLRTERLLEQPFDPGDFELIDETGTARHACGHLVLWQFLPGFPGAEFLRAVKGEACPCCGGETGQTPPGIEWPAHVGLAGVGLAHCHGERTRCADVDAAHRRGLHLAERRN